MKSSKLASTIFKLSSLLLIGFMVGSLYGRKALTTEYYNYIPPLKGEIIVNADHHLSVSIYNGLADPIVVLEASDENKNIGQFTKFHAAGKEGKVYRSASQDISLFYNEEYPKNYGVILPGDNAVLRFNSELVGSITFKYYIVNGDNVFEPEIKTIVVKHSGK